MIRSLLKSPPFQLGVLWTGEYLENKVIVESKYDGIRVFVIVDVDNIYVVSRNGKRNRKLENLLKNSCKLPKQHVFDGEVFYKNWNETVSVYRNPESEKLKIHIFDYFTFEEYKNKKNQIAYT